MDVQTHTGPARPRKVLVVEDDNNAREAIAAVVTDQGLEVCLAGNGQEALEVLHQERVDVIVLDLWLPVMDGWQFRAVQRADSALSAVPVIAISADRSPQAEAIHADCYVRKPFEAAQLVLALERVFLDQEQRRLAQKLRETERLTTLGTIAASIAHEVNNPLTYVLGNVHLLEERLASAPRNHFDLVEPGLFEYTTELLGAVRIGAERIHAVMATLQQLTWRPDSRRSAVDVRVVLETSLAILWNEIRHRARVTKDFQDVPLVNGDEARLGQVFVNLLANAAKAIPPGRYQSNEIRVMIRAVGHEVVVEMHDTGVGIPRDLHGRVFEPFFTTRPRGEGTGLGLTLSRNIVREHGGRIEFLSTPGQGSTFKVILPVSSGSRAKPIEPRLLEEQAASAPRAQILIVDDDPSVLESLRRMLEGQHQVTTTSRAREALKRLAAGSQYEAIVCDVMMPEMTGIEFFGELQQHRPDFASRVIFITAGGLLPEVRAFRSGSRNTWLEKPFRPRALQRAVDELIASLRSHSLPASEQTASRH
jgi:signal transduction histidine kinase